MENIKKIEDILGNIVDGAYKDKDKFNKDLIDMSFEVAKRNLDKAVENINHCIELSKGDKKLEKYAIAERANCVLYLSGKIMSDEEQNDIKDNNKYEIFNILIGLNNYDIQPYDSEEFKTFFATKSIKDFSSVENLLEYIKDKLNYSIHGNKYLKAMLNVLAYKRIYDLGLKYGIDIEGN